MASINNRDILKSIDYAKKNQLFDKLNNIYEYFTKGEDVLVVGTVVWNLLVLI